MGSDIINLDILTMGVPLAANEIISFAKLKIVPTTLL